MACYIKTRGIMSFYSGLACFRRVCVCVCEGSPQKADKQRTIMGSKNHKARREGREGLCVCVCVEGRREACV